MAVAITKESLPLATIQAAVFEFLRERHDVVVFEAQAVNAYVGEPRMTQDIDLMSIRALELVEELREYLSQRFYIAARVREVKEGQGYRLYQVQKSGNRHLIDVRQVEYLPLAQPIEQVLVMAPAELIANFAIAKLEYRLYKIVDLLSFDHSAPKTILLRRTKVFLLLL
ncbi:MAG: hypothetical protein F6K14_29555 [Symploca sp. SIO2C1]|nr:hypothetical protein [Symploca sp. SIO2C1]